ncbi:hypothetical protein [Deinococcus hohokamensis]|uniref:DUF7919 domain-containing protein n=1 Tax=Deinococcus hohokamensis TaxID=309883 RepID=A0ABV9I6G8_9DEIO
MHYPDLEEYCYADPKSERYAYFELRTRNIGWLWSDVPFEQGTVPAEVTRKLRDVLIMGSFREEVLQRLYPSCTAPSDFRTEIVRGPVLPCPLCGQEPVLDLGVGLPVYPQLALGRSEYAIPNPGRSLFYVFPDLLLHYIGEHGYRPPAVFVQALEALDLCGGVVVETLMSRRRPKRRLIQRRA